MLDSPDHPQQAAAAEVSHRAELRQKRAVINDAWRIWSTAAIPATLRSEIEEAAKERSLSTPVLVAELCESYAAHCRLFGRSGPLKRIG